MRKIPTRRWEGAELLPSHLTPAQVARLLEVSPAAIHARIKGGLICVEILGSRMVPTSSLISCGLLEIIPVAEVLK